jgi:prolyl-tRNA synthetase
MRRERGNLILQLKNQSSIAYTHHTIQTTQIVVNNNSQNASGIYSYLPLGRRVIDNINRIIDEEMQRVGSFLLTTFTIHIRQSLFILFLSLFYFFIFHFLIFFVSYTFVYNLFSFEGAQKLVMPILQSSDLWKLTGRWESTGSEVVIHIHHSHYHYLIFLHNFTFHFVIE